MTVNEIFQKMVLSTKIRNRIYECAW